MRALITGGRGFVGRHFARTLLESGWKVRLVDVAGREPVDARDLFRRAGLPGDWDLVVHAAARVGGRAAIEKNALWQAHNLELDAALFQWARTAEPGRIIYFSSSAVYPVALQVAGTGHRLSETNMDTSRPILGRPDELYGWAKMTGEELARRSRLDGQHVTVVRPFSGYGEDQDLHYPWPSFARRARDKQDPFTIWGTGRQVRDWIHIDDVVAAALVISQRDIPEPVNLCSGVGLSMIELVNRMCEAAGYNPVLHPNPDAPAGVAYRVGDPTRMERYYQRTVSLEDGIERSLRYSLQPG